ncbi:MAG: HU family DNA-binding protein [Deinococcota bacterium]|jgi:DNA-binding protein HU-beta|nr:HU family DNA-binding protein [Deinococcota bacterium]
MAENVSKAHLVDAVAEKHGLNKKDVKAVMDGLFDHIALHLNRGDKVQISGFGTFEIRDRQARTGVKPGTSEKISIPASKYPAFKPGKSLKDTVNS